MIGLSNRVAVFDDTVLFYPFGKSKKKTTDYVNASNVLIENPITVAK